MADIFTDTLPDVKDHSYVQRGVETPSALEGIATIGAQLVTGGAELHKNSVLKDFTNQVNEVVEAHRQGVQGVDLEYTTNKLDSMTRTFIANRPHLAKEARSISGGALGADPAELMLQIEMADIKGDIGREQAAKDAWTNIIVKNGGDPTVMSDDEQRMQGMALQRAENDLATLTSTGAKEINEGKFRATWLNMMDASSSVTVMAHLRGADLDDPNTIQDLRKKLAAAKADAVLQAGGFAANFGGGRHAGLVDKLREDVEATFGALDLLLDGNVKANEEFVKNIQTQMEMKLAPAIGALTMIKNTYGEAAVQTWITQMRSSNHAAFEQIEAMIGQSTGEVSDMLAELSKKKSPTDVPRKDVVPRKDREDFGQFMRGEVPVDNLGTTPKRWVVGSAIQALQTLQGIPDSGMTPKDHEDWARNTQTIVTAALSNVHNTEDIKRATLLLADPKWVYRLGKASEQLGGDDNEWVRAAGTGALKLVSEHMQRVGDRNVTRQAEKGELQLAYNEARMQFVLVDGEHRIIDRDIFKTSSDFKDRQIAQTDLEKFNDVDTLNKALTLGVKLKRFDNSEVYRKGTDSDYAKLIAGNVTGARLDGAGSVMGGKPSRTPINPTDEGLNKVYGSAPIGHRIRRVSDGTILVKTEEGYVPEKPAASSIPATPTVEEPTAAPPRVEVDSRDGGGGGF